MPSSGWSSLLSETVPLEFEAMVKHPGRPMHPGPNAVRRGCARLLHTLGVAMTAIVILHGPVVAGSVTSDGAGQAYVPATSVPCPTGLVWRERFDGDTVCVLPGQRDANRRRRGLMVGPASSSGVNALMVTPSASPRRSGTRTVGEGGSPWRSKPGRRCRRRPGSPGPWAANPTITGNVISGACDHHGPAPGDGAPTEGVLIRRRTGSW